MHELINRWQGKRISVIGDVCEDRWIYGTVHRMSPEAPVPVLVKDFEKTGSGMAGLVADMVTALGGVANLASTKTDSTKTRIMARVPGRAYQPLCRVDDEDCVEIMDARADEVFDRAFQTKPEAVILSDYGKGSVSQYLAYKAIATCRNLVIPILVDPQRGIPWVKYRRASVVKANREEWATSGFGRASEAISTIGLDSVIVTSGEHGMMVYEAYSGYSVPGRSCVGVDVTGAGDELGSVIGLALASGIALSSACELANVAAMMQVQRLGCVPVTAEELDRELGND